MTNNEYRSYNSDAIISDDDHVKERITNEVVVDESVDDEVFDTDEDYTNEQPKEPKKRSRIVAFIFLMLTGNVLTMREVSKYYSHMIVVALLFFLSIMVLFGALHLDVRYNQLANEVQMLRERSVRLKQLRSDKSSHAAVLEELDKRGIDLGESKQPAIINGDF